jgi:hypothetical protein
MDRTKEQHQLLCKSRRECDEGPGNDWTSFQGRKHEPYTERPKSPRPKEVKQVKRKVKSILITFLDVKGIVHKEFVLTS